MASEDMRKNNRLRNNADFERVRREGATRLHPIVVIAYRPNGLGNSRFGFTVGRKIGKAVKRNQIKRWMREAVRLRLKRGEISPGWDVVLIARRTIETASFRQVDQAIDLVLRRAGLVSEAL
jgi:ribonuclease P protein component